MSESNGSTGTPDGPEAQEEARLVELAGRIFGAARAGDAGALEAFLAGGAPVDLANEGGDTLLMLASYHGHAEAVSVLLARGADPNKANDRGQTPLAGTVFKGHDAVLDELLAAGADPHAGQPSAFATAQMFQKSEVLAKFGRA
ncbi:ankyrin repeat domain-containing protein [Kitasatospora viridis]|uniref:Uncharacterized protein n=1 Tax=Kitasatospora viridis TaxID=281105 RepID=A0A561SF59_9ACTN|nr:ankyrin repeat domain-containing protein [Kitasatospora viridis]TWF73492.1 hypothetical protein FHX73_15104 [Kitasatospora viridis]